MAFTDEEILEELGSVTFHIDSREWDGFSTFRRVGRGPSSQYTSKRDYRRQYYLKHREHLLQLMRNYMDRLRADPVRWAEYSEKARERSRAKRAAKGIPARKPSDRAAANRLAYAKWSRKVKADPVLLARKRQRALESYHRNKHKHAAERSKREREKRRRERST